jgi:curli biogenesis system outer membrane secretion channel CsgG
MIRITDLLRWCTVIVLTAASVLGSTSVSRADAKPSIAVLDFSTSGLTDVWWGDFQPGIALSDLVTDQLVNGHKFNVVERKKLDAVMTEHKLSTDGEVSPATYIQSGQLTGARYIVTGNVLQFNRTSSTGGSLGGFLRNVPGVGAAGINVQKVTLRVQVHIVDTTTGSIVASMEDEKQKSGTSFNGFGAGAGFAGFGAGSYSSETFTSSTMGQLINDEAADIVAKFDPATFAGGGTSAATISGRIISADSFGIILNIGSSKGVETGMYFNVIKERQIKDPDSGKMLTVTAPTAKVQITQVNADSAVATRVSGVVAVGERVSLAAP